MADGPFTDDMVRHMLAVGKTHEGIRKYGEAMAVVLAEAAIASQKALGHSTRHALDQWISIIRDRALQLIEEKKEPAPMLKKLAAMEGLIKDDSNG